MGGRADYAQAKRCDEPRFFVRHGLTIIDCEMRYGRERMRDVILICSAGGSRCCRPKRDSDSLSLSLLSRSRRRRAFAGFYNEPVQIMILQTIRSALDE